MVTPIPYPIAIAKMRIDVVLVLNRCPTEAGKRRPLSRARPVTHLYSTIVIRGRLPRLNTPIGETQMGEPPAPDAETLAILAALYHDHPRWAIWLPQSGGHWTAVRPAGSRPPSAQSPILWVRADTSTELGERMRNADGTLHF
jgi:hypothetical protein